MLHIAQSPTGPYQLHSQMSHLNSYACSQCQTAQLFQFKKLHLNYGEYPFDLYFSCISQTTISEKSVLVMLRQPYWYMSSASEEFPFIIKNIPAPMFKILLSFLINCETMSRMFYQFWYQSNSVEFLCLRNEDTMHSASTKRFVYRSGCSFKSTFDIFIN